MSIWSFILKSIKIHVKVSFFVLCDKNQYFATFVMILRPFCDASFVTAFLRLRHGFKLQN